MRGSFRDPEVRRRARAQWENELVPRLARTEIQPLAKFVGDRTLEVVIDIGANKGLWTKALLDTFPGRVRQVHLFDPSPENCWELRNRDDNLVFAEADFPLLEIHECAMGDEPGTATLFTNEDGSPLASLYEHEAGGWGRNLAEIKLDQQIPVTVETVDSFLERTGIERVQIMKLDTEGHELSVLRGSMRALRERRVEVIPFEFGAHHVESRVFFKDFWQFFESLGYRMHSVRPNGSLETLVRYEYRWEQFHRNWTFIAALPRLG